MSASTISDAPASPGSVVRAVWIAIFWVALVAVDLLMKLGGFRAVHRMVTRWRVGRRSPRAGEVQALAEAVDRAARWYPKRAWCLQRSVVGVCVLRARGIPAELVIGVRKMPFFAHAWVEVDGAVVNDDAEVQRTFAVMERCRP